MARGPQKAPLPAYVQGPVKCSPGGLTGSPLLSNSFQGRKISFGGWEERDQYGHSFFLGCFPLAPCLIPLSPKSPRVLLSPTYPPSCPDSTDLPGKAPTLRKGHNTCPPLLPNPSSPLLSLACPSHQDTRENTLGVVLTTLPLAS